MTEIEQAMAEYRIARADWLESLAWCGKEQWRRRKEVIIRRKRIDAAAERLWAIRDAERARQAAAL
jgi:hypothetical protein